MVIRDIDLGRIKFFNIDYRHYIGIWKIDQSGFWIVQSHPFAISLNIRSHDRVDNITSQNPKLETTKYPDDYNYVFNYHHKDRDKIGLDPCDIYEWISGINIHSGESDDHMMGLDFYSVNKEFVDYMRVTRRLEKIEKLGI